MRKFIVTNISSGQTYEGSNLDDVFTKASWDRLPGEKLTLKEVTVKANQADIKKIIDRMMQYDPNGTWFEINYTDTDDIETTLKCAIEVLNRWASEETNTAIKYSYYRMVMDIEVLLGK